MVSNTKAVPSLPQYWLTTSMYAGPFYEDSDLMLIDYRPLNSIDDAKTPDGRIIYPPSAELIIPAGTLVQILKISYPNAQEAQKRPLYSPKDHIWVYLRIAKERGQVSVFFEKDHILVVPKKVKSKEALKTFLNSLMSKKDPHTWILGARNYIQEGIWLKKPVIGMNKRDLKAALGPPEKIEPQTNDGEEGSFELWRYPHYFIMLKDGQVIKVKNLAPKTALSRA